MTILLILKSIPISNLNQLPQDVWISSDSKLLRRGSYRRGGFDGGSKRNSLDQLRNNLFKRLTNSSIP